MIDVREVLRRWQAGQSARQMAREGVVSRRTAARYIEAAKELGLAPDSELTDEAVRAVAERVQARPEPEPSEVRQVLEQHRSRIEHWLEHDLTLVRVHELLARDGISVAYTTLRRYAHDELGWKERGPTVLIDDPPPGEEAQPIYSGKASARMDLSDSMAAAGELYYTYDPNRSTIATNEGSTANVRIFNDPHSLGFNLLLQARF